jgi:hypothetical protein
MREDPSADGREPHGGWRPETLAERHRRLNARATIPGTAGTGAPNPRTSAGRGVPLLSSVQPLRGGWLGRISTRL